MPSTTAVLDDRKITLATEVYHEAIRVLGLQHSAPALQEIVATSAIKHAAATDDRSQLLEATLRSFFQDLPS